MSKFDRDLFNEKYRIKSKRMAGYDYSQLGHYSVTICTKNMIEYFGTVIRGKMILNKYGKIVNEQLKLTELIRDYVLLDEFIVMPNHIHVIVVINCNIFDYKNVETRSFASLQCCNEYRNKFGPQSHNLASIIRGFKSACTKQIHDMGLYDFAWQPNYYEHIIRDEKSLNNIREYIRNNPRDWISDRNNI